MEVDKKRPCRKYSDVNVIIISRERPVCRSSVAHAGATLHGEYL